MDLNLYKQILFNSNYGFLLCKISEEAEYDLIIIEYNEVFSNILKSKSENLKGELISILVGNQKYKAYFSLLKQLKSIANYKQSKSTEFYSESNRKWYKINSFFITEENTVSFIIEEISKYKSKNVELESFFSLNLDLLCVADTDGYFHKLNKEWENTLGYTLEELEGRKFHEFIHPEDLESSIEIAKSLSKQIELKSFVNRYLCKDGSYKWIEWRSKPNGRLLFAAARDITEKILKEKELNDSIEKYNFLLDSSLDIIYSFSKDGTIRYVSKSWLNLFSCSENLPTNLNIFDLICENNRQDFKEFLEKNDKTNSKTEEFEHEICYNNKTETFNTVISILRNSENGIESYVANSISITYKKEYEKKLKDNESKYKSLFHNHTAIKLIINPLNGQIVNANTSASDFYGWSIEELKSMYIYDINTLSKDEINKLMQNVKENNLNNFEVKHRKKDGSLCDVEIFSSSFNNNGDIFLHSIIHDISYKKATEKLLKEAKQTFVNIFNGLTEAIYILDSNLTFIEVNEGAEIMYEYTKLELIGKTPADLSAPGYNNLSKIINILNEIFLNGGTVNFEFWAVKKSGVIFPKEVIVTKGFYFGEEVLIATARDITNRKNLENKLRESNSAKDMFLSIIAHDLRGPFNGIIGLTSILNENIKNNNYSKAGLITEKILKASENTFLLLTDLMNWAKAQTNNIEIKLENILLFEIIEETISIYSSNIQEKSISIDCVGDKNSKIYSDLELTKTIIRNLLSNAVKFTPQGGKIEISWKNIETGIEICIKDSGIAMTEEILKNLFQIDKSIGRLGTNKEPSTGLGLIICKEFILKLNGNIWATNNKDQGSSFYISLPSSFLNN